MGAGCPAPVDLSRCESSHCRAAGRLGVRQSRPSLAHCRPRPRQLVVWAAARDIFSQHLGGPVRASLARRVRSAEETIPVPLDLSALRIPGSRILEGVDGMSSRLRGQRAEAASADLWHLVIPRTPGPQEVD
jgi:hypothetical protein